MSIPTGRQLARDFRSLAREQRDRLRARITSDDVEIVEPIRADKVLAAREAVRTGAYDAPEIFDCAFDNLVDSAWREKELEEARRADG